ncbi:MAG TPA: UbiD family decarboxylase [Terriglobia bacterium]|nr:UbiD family decarboxylase [Terriglobia bacterium]
MILKPGPSIVTYRNLREYLEVLRQDGDLATIGVEVDPFLELAEIHRRVVEQGGPCLYFKRVKNSPFPVVTNLFGTLRRIERAFGPHPLRFMKQITEFAETAFPPTVGKLWKHRGLIPDALRMGTRRVNSGPVMEVMEQPPDLNRLPILTVWPKDGGPFVTLPLVYSENPKDKRHNLGVYRMQRFDSTTTGMHWQIHKGGGFHYKVAEQLNEHLPLSVFLGGPPALILAAIAPLPENVGELMMASVLAGKRLTMIRGSNSPHPFPAEAEFVLQGHVPSRERHPEGPFGDHYGYYSLQHDYPVFRVERIYRRKDAIYPATVVGKPRQEDYFIGNYLQELLSPLFPFVMPGVEALWSYGETGFHSLSAAIVKERYAREAMVSAFRILGEGQLSLTKFLIVVNSRIDLKDFQNVLTHVLERIRWETDFFILSNLSMDTLDYCGPEINRGSKAIMLGLGEPVRSLPREFRGQVPPGVHNVRAFSPGCLVIAGVKYDEEPDQAARLAQWGDFSDWQLLILVDDDGIAGSASQFLWAVFTRFDPASNITAAGTVIRNHHLCYRSPIAVDARMKPRYPAEVECDPETAKKVDQCWREYFPR